MVLDKVTVVSLQQFLYYSLSFTSLLHPSLPAFSFSRQLDPVILDVDAQLVLVEACLKVSVKFRSPFPEAWKTMASEANMVLLR